MGEIIYNNKKYVQDKVPNWDDVCKLVDKAKGPNRTWKKFYEDCDKEISQATFTRITHKQYKKALKQEMMQLIVDNAAKPTDVTMERMLQANGYVDESDAEWCLNLYGSKVGFHTGKNELFPFPFAETQINPNITQNPGWE